MTERKTGTEVVDQAQDASIWNTEPAVVRGVVISIVGAVGTILVVFGWLDADQKQQLEENAGTIAVAVLVIVPILQGLWTRLAAYAPRTAAEIAVENTDAAYAAGQVGATKPAPTLAPPP